MKCKNNRLNAYIKYDKIYKILIIRYITKNPFLSGCAFKYF